MAKLLTGDLRINDLSRPAFVWLCGYLAAIDARDIEDYLAYLSNEVVLQINTNAPIIGVKAIKDVLGARWRTLADCQHDIINIYGDDDRFVVEAMNHYLFVDGRKISARTAAFIDRNQEGLVTSVRLYADAIGV